jgi:cytochrome P450
MAIDATKPVPPQFARIAGRDNIPAHVPPELVRSAEVTFGKQFLAAPHDYMARLQDTMPPIFYDVNMYGNAWQLLKYEDAFFMLRHPDIFSNEGATPFPRDPNDYFYFIPIEIDPPHHRKYRAILDQQFSPQGVLKLEQKIRVLANELIDQFIDKRECEFTTEFGRPLPVSVFLDLMGLPQEKRDTFVKWAVDLLHSQDRAIMAESMRLIGSYLKEVIAQKQENPDDNVISRIAHATIDGRPISPPEVFGFVIFLFIGGLDTVFATLNNMWLWLANNPDRVREMIADPANINAQVEELLRVWSVTFSGRMLAQDYEMRGVKMKKGDRVSAVLPAATTMRKYFPTRRWWTSIVRAGRSSRSPAAFTAAWGRTWHGWKSRLRCRRLRRIPSFSVKPGTHIEYRPGAVVGPEYVPLVW